MADKEATVYVVDVGRSMGDKHHGRDVSDLDWAMQYVWDKITAQVATGRKTLCGGVVGFRTDETSHSLQNDEGYEHITMFKDLAQFLMPDIRHLHEQIKPNRTKRGDAISAIVLAQDMISKFCKHNKYKKRIIVVTNGDGAMEIDREGVDPIAAKLKEDSIELVILGADFDDEDYGFTEAGKSDIKRENEVALRYLAEQCDGVFGTLKEAIDELGTPRLKSTRPVPSYKGKLRLGDPELYDSALQIDVERYPRTMVAMAPTATRYNVKQEKDKGATMTVNEAGESATDDKDTGVMRQSRTYEIRDESLAGGKREVNRDDLAKGFSYGNSAVHIEQSDENVTKLETTAGLEILGFIPQPSYKHYFGMSRTNVIIAQRTNDLAAMALSAFIWSLHELESFAIARLVTKEWKAPVLLLLAPEIKHDSECLIDVELPFAEDFRQHKFPPLNRIITMSGKERTEHRNLPTQELKDAMSAFVDHMDLSQAGEEDDDGKPTEYAKIEDTFSLKLHRIHQIVQFRAVHPDEPVPPPPDALTRFSHPPKHLLQGAEPYLAKLQDIANVKKVPPRAKGRDRTGPKRDADQPMSGLDVRALLTAARPPSRTTISEANAIPEFKQHFDESASVATLERAVAQLGAIVRRWIAGSLGDSAYARAAEAVGVMRAECIDFEVAGLYNGFLEELKRDLFAGRLGGDRREMWWLIRSGRLGPIPRAADERSEYDEETARVFMLPDRTAAG